MGKFHVDNREDKGEFALIPDGQYKVKIKSATLEEGTKAPYLKINMTIREGVGAKDPEEFSGQPLQSRLSLSQKALWKMNQFLDALGYRDNDQDYDTNDLVDREIYVQVVQGEYEGKERSEVASFSSGPRAEKKEKPKTDAAKPKADAKTDAKPAAGKDEITI